MKNWIWALPAILLVLGVSAFAYLYMQNSEANVADDSENELSEYLAPMISEEVYDHHQVIGYVGCSNTWQTIEGYHAAGGDKFWEVNKNYGGGHVTAWSTTINRDSRHWQAFDQLHSEHPDTDAIWWELCVRHEEVNVQYKELEKTLKEIQARVPDATIYVSSLPAYPDGECFLTHDDGIAHGAELVLEILKKNPELKAGPVLQPMTAAKTLDDGCHIKEDSRPLLGEELINFFG